MQWGVVQNSWGTPEDPLGYSSCSEISLSGGYPLWSIWGTLPETNTPENVPLEEEIHLYKTNFGVLF